MSGGGDQPGDSRTRDYRTILVTGGAGFVGSSLAIRLAADLPSARVFAADNLRRRGSELVLERLRATGVRFLHADVRNPEDLALRGLDVDLLVDCAAEPSILAAYAGDVEYVINTNLMGSVHSLQVARRTGADVLFLSTSRVYPVASLNAIRVEEAETRYRLALEQDLPGVSRCGIAEDFPLLGARSLYGTTKLASELLLHEFAEMYGLRFIVNRCGVIAGPWQMGKVDQGVFTLWAAHHVLRKPLQYVGWGGTGKQVRDILHIDDASDLVARQAADFARFAGGTYNVGGGPDCSLSLLEATEICRRLTGTTVPVDAVSETRRGDVRIYVSDIRRIAGVSGWTPRRTAEETLESIVRWLKDNMSRLAFLWGDA
jgi:CDP-paratose 2-epimerase